MTKITIQLGQPVRTQVIQLLIRSGVHYFAEQSK